MIRCNRTISRDKPEYVEFLKLLFVRVAGKQTPDGLESITSDEVDPTVVSGNRFRYKRLEAIPSRGELHLKRQRRPTIALPSLAKPTSTKPKIARKKTLKGQALNVSPPERRRRRFKAISPTRNRSRSTSPVAFSLSKSNGAKAADEPGDDIQEVDTIRRSIFEMQVKRAFMSLVKSNLVAKKINRRALSMSSVRMDMSDPNSVLSDKRFSGKVVEETDNSFPDRRQSLSRRLSRRMSSAAPGIRVRVGQKSTLIEIDEEDEAEAVVMPESDNAVTTDGETEAIPSELETKKIVLRERVRSAESRASILRSLAMLPQWKTISEEVRREDDDRDEENETREATHPQFVRLPDLDEIEEELGSLNEEMFPENRMLEVDEEFMDNKSHSTESEEDSNKQLAPMDSIEPNINMEMPEVEEKPIHPLLANVATEGVDETTVNLNVQAAESFLSGVEKRRRRILPWIEALNLAKAQPDAEDRATASIKKVVETAKEVTPPVSPLRARSILKPQKIEKNTRDVQYQYQYFPKHWDRPALERTNFTMTMPSTSKTMMNSKSSMALNRSNKSAYRKLNRKKSLDAIVGGDLAHIIRGLPRGALK